MMTRREALAAGVAVAAGPQTLPAADDDPTAVARAAVREYGKNLRAFSRYQCQFTSRSGSAASAADARAGKIEADIGGDSTLAVDGRRVRLDNHGMPPSKGLAGKKGEPIPGTNLGRVAADFFEEDVYLTNGREELHGNDLGLNVYTPDLPASPQPPHPLTTGQFDFRLGRTPDRMAEKPDEFDIRGEGRQTLDDRATVRVRFEARGGELAGQYAYVVDFDPARGHLPYRTQVLYRLGGANKPLRVVYEAWVPEAKDCGKGRFFPTRVVSVSVPEGDKPGVSVWETAVRSIDPDFTPARDTFEYRPPVKGGHVVYSRGQVYASVGIGPDEVFTPESLPGVVERLRAKLPK